MPQFDLAVFLPQVFWLVICFTVLYAFTIGYSIPRLKKAYEDRWQHTEGTRLEAVKLHRQAQDITNTFERELQETRRKASELVNQQLREISQYNTDQKNQILSEMKQKLSNAELRISERKLETILRSQHLAETLSSAIIAKLIGTKI